MQPRDEPTYRFETNAIHFGQNPRQWSCRSVVPPIALSVTFQQTAPNQHAGFSYARINNPTRNVLETCLASLENARYALCYSSGLAATENVTHLLKAGDHAIVFDDIFGGVLDQFRECAIPHGIEVDFVDATDLEKLAESFKPNTKLVWIETPSNPTMRIVDITGVANLIKELAPEAILAVDNTFMSPYFQNPLSLGADVVMHSASKYINGHSDALMGCIMVSREDIYKRLRFLQNALGAVPSPFDCYLINRGIKTLAVRMRKHQENGLRIADYLERHPLVLKVLHPGLPSHPQYELAKTQCRGFSGMLSFYIAGDGHAARVFLSSLKIFVLALSLGSVESLAEVPSLMTHASLKPEKKAELGITDNLVRLSIGLEDPEDLIADLNQALLATTARPLNVKVITIPG